MDHDYTHCLDYCKECPGSCFRAEVTRDLEKRHDLHWLPVSWAHFKGTDECLGWPKKGGKYR